MDIQVKSNNNVTIECRLDELMDLLNHDKGLVKEVYKKLKNSEKAQSKKAKSDIQSWKTKADSLIQQNIIFTVSDITGSIKNDPRRAEFLDWLKKERQVILTSFDNPQYSILIIPYVYKNKRRQYATELSSKTKKQKVYRNVSHVEVLNRVPTLVYGD